MLIVKLGLIVGLLTFQAQVDPYLEVANKRAEKIVATLGIADKAKLNRIQNLVAGQYKALHDIHGQREVEFKEAGIGATSRSNPKAIPIQEKYKPAIQKLHHEFLLALQKELDGAGVDKVKDGMTYGVVGVTYKVYLEYLPRMTEAQKAKIMTLLVEARELAMDEGSSEEKHAMFKVYKGKINNYLAEQGYDLRKAEKELQEKRRQEKEKK